MKPDDYPKLPLGGIRVIDWSLMHVGPYAATMLADLGADVIHVEERSGEWTRGMVSFMGEPLIFKDKHIQFEHLNQNKRGLAVDLKKPGAVEIIYRLVEKSDVFLTNYREAAAKKLGLDYESLRQRNPKLIYAHASAFGDKGPDAGTPGYESIGFAKSGALLSGNGEVTEPVSPTVGIGDRITAIFLAYATMVALIAKERFGIGQKVTTSLLGSLINLQGWSVLSALFFNRYAHTVREKATNPMHNWYRCKDDVWINMTIYPPTRWTEFCNALGIPEVGIDSRYDTDIKRADKYEELIPLLDKVFVAKLSDYWEKLFKQHDFSFSRVMDLTDLATDPQVIANKYVIDWDHPLWGSVKFPGFPFNLSETPPSLRSPAPEIGQHTEEILLEVGYSWDEITRLKEKEVI